LLTVTPRAGAMLPTAVSRPSHSCSDATAVPTISGGGPACAMAWPMWMSFEIWETFTPARPAMTATRATNART
jgi:hypothetical protein